MSENKRYTTMKDVDEECPVCGKLARVWTRCLEPTYTCPNGHNWHIAGHARKEQKPGDPRWHVVETWYEKEIE